FGSGPVVIGSFAGGTDGSTPLVITFNASATPAAAQALARNITYENVATDPDTDARTVRFVVDDGDGGTSTAVTETINVSGDHILEVTTTSDASDGTTTSIDALLGDRGPDGQISLREAIEATNATANGGSPDEIHFEIPGGSHTISIGAVGLDSIAQPVIIDGTTDMDYGGTPIIELDGSAQIGGNGLTITGGGSTIRGLVINRFDGDGILITTNGGNFIEGNYIGTNVAGTAPEANGDEGIEVQSGSNTIGGTGVSAGNLVSGNADDGILITGAGATGNDVQGNYVGTNAAGTGPVPNGANGIAIKGGATGNTIGGTDANAENLISGNTTNGIAIRNAGTSGNFVEGNLIGTNLAGTGAVANGAAGIQISDSASGNTIGGTTSDHRNLVSGNTTDGVELLSTAGVNTILGNDIGTNLAGSGPIANAIGIDIQNNGNTIGGTAAGVENVIAGNTNDGIVISGDNNVVLGNTIGVLGGVLFNGANGVLLTGGATGNEIGGDGDDDGNVIRHNGADGVQVDATAGSGNAILRNLIYDHGELAIDLGSDDSTHTSFETATDEWEVKSDTNVGQTFSYTSGNGAYTVNRITLQLREDSAPNQTITVSLRTAWNGTVLASADTLASSLTNTMQWIDFDFGGVSLTDGTSYTIRVTSDTTDGKIFIATNTSGGYPDGTQLDVTGLPLANEDVVFRVSNTNGVTANDAGDGDGGPNLLQNYPVLTLAATNLVDTVWVEGTLDTDLANQDYRIELYTPGGTQDASSHGEGFDYLGAFTVTTDGSGDATFSTSISAALAANRTVTATATADLGGGSYGGTSELSLNVLGNVVPFLTMPGGAVAFTEGDGPTIIDAGATVIEVDSTDYDTGNLTVDFTANGTANDRLAINDQGAGSGNISLSGTDVTYDFGSGPVVIGSFAGGTDGSTPLVITFNASSDPVSAQALVRNITYDNVATDPDTAARTARFVVDDGDGGTSTAVSETINVSGDHILEVTTIADAVDGTTTSIDALLGDRGPDGQISLREAIEATNTTANGGSPDEIHFDIAGAGPHVITLNAVEGALPAISDAVVIDASTEPDYTTDNPVVRVDGDNLGGGEHGFDFDGTSDGSVLRGLMITRFPGDGVLVQSGANGITIAGNWIGTEGGTSWLMGNADDGLDIRGSTVTIGGTGAGDRNLITHSNDEGITIVGSGATNHVIQGNWIGLLTDGTAGAGNSDVGLAIISGSDNTIGGTAATAGNVISNNFEGIEINTNNNVVEGNYIGTDPTGLLDRGNRSDDGVEIQGGADDNRIGGTGADEGNIIAFNAGDGVYIASGTGNLVQGNEIHSNTQLGIDLGTNGVTGNDGGDGDPGANDLLNFPVIYSATISGGNVTITGEARPNAVVEFFEADTEATDYGEGRTFIGRNTVSGSTPGTDDATARQFSFVFPVGSLIATDEVTATATDAANNTSEFSLNEVVVDASINPSISLPGGALSYTEADPETVIDAGALVSDPDSADFDTGNLTVDFTTNGTANDRLDINDQGAGSGNISLSGTDVTYDFGSGPVIIGSFAGGTDGSTPLVITFNTSATPAAAQALARNITYRNVAVDPDTDARTVRFVVDDGDGGTSAAATETINVAGDGVLVVTTTADTLDGDTTNVTALLGDRGPDGEISLREAILATNDTPGTFTLSLSSVTYELTLAGGDDFSGDFDIKDDLIILGVDAASTIVDGNDVDRVFHVQGATVTFRDLTIRDGSSGGNRGGGVHISAGGNVTVDQSVVTSNDTTDVGGGINNDGTVVITDSTISTNTAGGNGGGIYNTGTATLTRVTISGNDAPVDDGGGIYTDGVTFLATNVTISGNTADRGAGFYEHSANPSTLQNVTITNNTATSRAGGIEVSGGSLLTVRNTIVAGNVAATEADLKGTIASSGNNLVGDTNGGAGFAGSDILDVSPLLDALADNGGTTETHALLAGSRGINEGSNTGAPATDQRGVARPDVTADIGAYEENYLPVATEDPGDYAIDLQALTPIGYWRFGETAGAASDLGSTANDGTYSGGTLGQPGALNGDSDTAVRFDGLTDHVLITHSNDYLLDDGTVQLWFNADTPAGGDLQHLWSKDSQGYDTGGHLSLYLTAAGNLEVRLQSASADYNVTSPSAVSGGVWHHAAVTFGAQGLALYLDGARVDIDNYTGGFGTTSGGAGNFEPIAIGGGTQNSGNLVATPVNQLFAGLIDEVAILNIQLGADLIQDLYAAGLQHYSTAVNTTLNVIATEGVLSNDFDDNEQSLTAIEVTPPSNAASFTLNPDGSFDYTPAVAFTGTDTFTYKVNDGITDGNTVTVSISVTDADPVVTLPGAAVSYTEGDVASIIDATATVTDTDSADFDTGNLTVDFTANGTANDRLAINDQGAGSGNVSLSGTDVTYDFGAGPIVIGSFAGGTDGSTPLVITFNASATPASAQALARNITFDNVSQDPSETARTVRFIVTDGDGGTSTAVTETINVARANDAPVLADVVVALNDITEDDGAPSGAVGTLVSDLADFTGGGGQNNVTDVDSGAVTGIAITGADTANGTW
ncbi:MAG: hypothetical protein CMJ18_13445, partial [Phycisphaeraceae bacterium]|nr:hypothetical protein [Phycisphaeraceae bacterium]